MENRKIYFDTKCAETFKAAFNQHDRNLVNIENQSHASTGLSELSMTNMFLFLLQHYAEKDIYDQNNTSKKEKGAPSTIGDLDTVKQMKEGRGRPYNRNGRGRPFTRGYGNPRGQQDTFRGQPVGGQRYYRGRGGSRGQYTSTNFRGQSNSQNRGNFQGHLRGQPGNRSRLFNSNFRGTPRSQGQRRKFVMPANVNVGITNCLKCGSREHRFQNPQCKYFSSPLFSSPCPNCQRGGHGGKFCTELYRNYLGSTTQPRYQNRREYVNSLQEILPVTEDHHIQQLQEDNHCDNDNSQKENCQDDYFSPETPGGVRSPRMSDYQREESDYISADERPFDIMESDQ